MNRKYLQVAAIIPLMMTGNAQAQPAATPAGDAGIRIENLDKTADPAVDFYQYACGGWMKTHPLKGEY